MPIGESSSTEEVSRSVEAERQLIGHEANFGVLCYREQRLTWPDVRQGQRNEFLVPAALPGDAMHRRLCLHSLAMGWMFAVRQSDVGRTGG
jgi:hypothetical protein